MYRVLLTENPRDLSYDTVAGAIGLTSVDPPGGPTAGKLTLRVGTAIFGGGTQATVPVEALNGVGLHAAYVEVDYDEAKLVPAKCAPNLNRFVERLSSPAVEADNNILVGHVVHLRVTTTAGSDLRYKWDFGDGTVQYDDRAVSHVYGSADSDLTTEAVDPYHVTVQVSSGVLEGVESASIDVNILATQSVAPTLLTPEDPAARTGCRISDGKIVLDLVARSKHGLTGDSRLADLTFTKKDAFTSGTATVAVSSANPDGAGLQRAAPTASMRGCRCMRRRRCAGCSTSSRARTRRPTPKTRPSGRTGRGCCGRGRPATCRSSTSTRCRPVST